MGREQMKVLGIPLGKFECIKKRDKADMLRGWLSTTKMMDGDQVVLGLRASGKTTTVAVMYPLLEAERAQWGLRDNKAVIVIVVNTMAAFYSLMMKIEGAIPYYGLRLVERKGNCLIIRNKKEEQTDIYIELAGPSMRNRTKMLSPNLLIVDEVDETASGKMGVLDLHSYLRKKGRMIQIKYGEPQILNTSKIEVNHG